MLKRISDEEMHKIWLTIGDPFIPRYLDVGRNVAQAQLEEDKKQHDKEMLLQEGYMEMAKQALVRELFEKAKEVAVEKIGIDGEYLIGTMAWQALIKKYLGD